MQRVWIVCVAGALGAMGGAGVFTGSASAQSGFVQTPRSGYVKLSLSTFGSNDFHDTDGNVLIEDGATFRQQNLLLYAEYGVLSFLTVGFNVPLLRVNGFSTSETGVGFGDLRLFLKAGTQIWGFHVAGFIEPELPTGRDDLSVGLKEDPDVRTLVPTGDGETNIWWRVAASRGFSVASSLPAYASVHVGYNLRTGFSDQLESGGEVGIKVWDFIWLQGRLTAFFTLKAPDELDPTGTFLFGEGTEYIAAGGSVAAQLFDTPFWATFDYQNTFANLRNLYPGSTFLFGVAADWESWP